jgi:hypothetical protein
MNRLKLNGEIQHRAEKWDVRMGQWVFSVRIATSIHLPVDRFIK